MTTRRMRTAAWVGMTLAALAVAMPPAALRAGPPTAGRGANLWSVPPAARAADLPVPVRKLIAVEGKGYLETVDGYRVLHLKGTPAEMGRQHGKLLKQLIRDNVNFLLRGREGSDPRKVELDAGTLARMAAATLLNSAFQKQVPQRFMDEMKALAEGADMPFPQVLAANLIPEAFHCSGFALLKEATACGQVLHGRVLDYGVALRLQERAVLIIQEPNGRQPFVNVSYAGFIGSVTGMNAAGVSIGEMGGGGTGRWHGVPMSFLVRMVLEEAVTLDQAVGVFQDNPRTCEYYYVIADARANRAVGMKAVPEKVELVQPGQAHPLLPRAVPSAVVLSAGSRYQALSKLVQAGCGTFTPESAIRLMDAPVAMKSNLHDALMVPGLGVLYVANAGPKGEPAWKQTYHRFDMRELTGKRPE
ncbi:MAG TPA: C45 family autoproteolytic acyltransferase/hydrolase [Phycisphaerae bacterium]|nr:C45 family autoproteolytic acyltransferase/hydrolase [Phycisphaerae bacterium]HQL76338.1 C45 family autoproteolytic acyltransferase/hydrolase [Phycisphaerae bacterium]